MMLDDELRRQAHHVVDNCDNDWSDAADLIFAALKAVRRETVEECAKRMDAESLPRPARILRALLPQEPER